MIFSITIIWSILATPASPAEAGPQPDSIAAGAPEHRVADEAAGTDERVETSAAGLRPGEEEAYERARSEASAALSGSEAEMESAAAALRRFAERDPDDGRAAAAWYRIGELAERRSAYREAVDAYAQSIARDARGRFARRATIRIERLEPRLETDAHQAIYEELDRVRRDYASLPREEALSRMSALLDLAPDTSALVELKFWLGNEHGEVRGEAAIGWEWYRRIIATEGLPPAQYYRAFNNMVMLAPQGGLIAKTGSEMERFMRAHPEIAAAVDLEALRVYALPMSYRRAMSAVAAFGLLMMGGLFLQRRAWRAFPGIAEGTWRPWRALLLLSWAVIGAAVIADLYEPGYLLPYLQLLPVLALLSLAWGAIGRCGPARTSMLHALFVVTVAVLSTIGSVWFVLSAHDLHAVMGF